MRTSFGLGLAALVPLSFLVGCSASPDNRLVGPEPGPGACAENNGGCDANARCAEGGAGVTCTCNDGFTGDGKTCDAALTACQKNHGGCDPHAACTVDAKGEAQCGACPAGFEGDGRTCVEIDPCAKDNGGCDANAACTMTGPGKSTCACLDGFAGDGKHCEAPALCADEPAPPASDIGKACSAGSNVDRCAVVDSTCSRKDCLFDRYTGSSYCTAPCNPATPHSCPSGFECVKQGCSGASPTVCAKVEGSATSCSDVKTDDTETDVDWFGAFPDGYEYSYAELPHEDVSVFRGRRAAAGAWSEALRIPNTPIETGKARAALREITRATMPDATYVAFADGVYRFADGAVTRETLGGASPSVVGVFRLEGGRVRAILREASGLALYDRLHAGAWNKVSDVSVALGDVGALESGGFLATCGTDAHLCGGATGMDIADIALPSGHAFAGLHGNKPLYVGKTISDFTLVTGSASVLRRHGATFVPDALPAGYSVALSPASIRASGFVTAGDATYLYLAHGSDAGERVSTFKYTDACWSSASAPLAKMAWGAADGTIHFYDDDRASVCAIAPK